MKHIRWLHIALIFCALMANVSAAAQDVFVTVGDFRFECNATAAPPTATLIQYTGQQTEVVIPEVFEYAGVTYKVSGIGNEYAQPFYDNTTLERVVMPQSVRAIAAEAFHGCSSLNYVKFGNVAEIGDYAFAHCSALGKVNLPLTTRHIGYGAFAHCLGLHAIVLPENVLTLMGATFEGTPITELQILGRTPPEVVYQLDNSGSIYSQCQLYIPILSTNDYAAATPWNLFTRVAEKPQSGDVNADGSIDVADMNILCNIILGKDSAENYDGRALITNHATVDVHDLNFIINLLLGIYQ